MSISRSFWKFCAKRRLPQNVTLKKKVHFDKATCPRFSVGLYASFEYIRIDFTGVLLHSQADEFFLCG
jgi:hypothetical protein